MPIHTAGHRAAALALAGVLFCTGGLAETRVTLVAPDAPLPCVVAADSPLERDAASDFCDYLSRVSGRRISLSSQAENERVVVHVGLDSFVKQHRPQIGKLRADGYLIHSVEEGERFHLILAGKVDRAAQWAVERFLRDYCGVRWLFPDPMYGEVVPRRPTITLDRHLSKTIEPDFVSRTNCGMYYFSPPRRLLRLGPYGHDYGSHAIQHIFSQNEFRQHPEWFAQFDGKRQWWSYGNGWQICTTDPGTVDRAVEYIDAFFAKNPHAPVGSIGQNDGNGWCQCARCDAFVNAFSPAYSTTERWFHWVNQVARVARTKHPGKWVEAMSYASTSEPPRFQLEPNVAVTKTFVLASEFTQAERWKDVCKSVNLYSYMYGASFLGFRHYPHAAQQFLKWGHDELGALSHVTECGGDWPFDGPKYYYLQRLQWDLDADVDRIMDEFCEASYGTGAVPLRAFWDRLEAVYERRQPGPYGESRKSWLFYQWVSWSESSYVQPNDEFREYTLEDVQFLDRCMSDAKRRTEDASQAVRFRLQRLDEAWRFQRSLLISYLTFYPVTLAVTVTSEDQRRAALERARQIAQVRRQRAISLAQMRSYPHINPRICQTGYWSWGAAISIFAHEETLLDALCDAVTRYHADGTGPAGAVAAWEAVAPSDSLYPAAQTQLALLVRGEPANRLVNGDFEAGDLRGWTLAGGQIGATRDPTHSGAFAARTTDGGPATLSQRVSVLPLERYRLTAWARYPSDPPKTSVPLEVRLDFFDGGQQISMEPRRSLLRTRDPAAGWVQLRSAVTVPPRADSALITLKRTFSGSALWDDVVFERIQPGPAVEQGSLFDPFDSERLDPAKWGRMPAKGGLAAPALRSGWLVLDAAQTYPITSLARFNDLLTYRGPKRYRLRFHTQSVSAKPGSLATNAAFSIGNFGQPTTRMLWYLYFSSQKRTQPMLSTFHDQGGVRVFSSSWNMKHLENRGSDLWCTFYFDPLEVVVYASNDRYDETEGALVCRYQHHMSNLTTNGSVYLTLYKGTYQVDEISLQPGPQLPP